ncbi:hypothetical protein ABFT23_19825 [Nocardioides sp. C4-1]|uniref:hypothetical protein n=1 Tax=Nocardioides sp. C4-1 TaxID=3151851 RepID=UPI0032665C9B
MNDQHHDQTRDEHGDEPWEGAMSSEFDRRVRDLNAAPLSLDSVRGKAMTIQRNRRLAVAGGILAAAAVIVPVAVAAGNGLGDSSPDDVPVATSTPSATDPATVDPAPAASGPSYLEGATWHRPDGSVYELPRATYDNVVQLGDRIVAGDRDNEGNLSIDLIEDGAVVETRDAAGGTALVANQAGDLAAYVTPDGLLQTIWADGERTLSDDVQGWSIRTVVGGPDCEDPEAGGSGCRVVLTNDMVTSDARSIDSHGIDDVALPGTQLVYDVDDAGRLAVISRLEDFKECSAVYDPETAENTIESCELRYTEFSPSGRYLLAEPAQTDGFGPAWIAVVDTATGDEVARFDPPGDGGPTRYSWIDDDTFAAQFFDFGAQEWSIQTLTIGDDQPTVVAGPVKGSDFESPFGLVGR